MVFAGGLFLSPSKVKAVGSSYYVSTTGSDAHDGSGADSAHAWLTINHAAQILTSGDTVYIEAGTYSGEIIPLNSGTSGSPITYTNYNNGAVIIDDTALPLGGDGAVYINGKDYIVFGGSSPTSKITIENVFGYCIGGVYAEGTTNVTIQNLYIQDTDLAGIAVYNSSGTIVNNCELYHTNHQAGQESISFVQDDLFTIENNSVHDTVDTTGRVGIDAKEHNTNGNIRNNTVYNITNGFGIYVDGGYTSAPYPASQNINIYDNVVYNTLAGLACGVETGDTNLVNINYYNNICYGNVHGIESDGGIATEVLGVSFINNTFYDNGVGSGSDIIMYGTANNYNAIIRNNIIQDSTSGIYAINYSDYANGGIEIDHNLLYNSGGAWNTGNVSGTSPVIANPLLVSPTTNFALQATSPAKDTGVNTNAPSVDFIGTSRPQNSIVDIGAYEYYSGVIPPPPTGNILDPNAISIIGVKAFQNVFEAGDILYFCEYNLAYATLPTLSPNETYSLSLIEPDGNTVVVTRSLFAYGYNIQSIYLTAAQVASIPITWGEGDYLRISPYPAFLAPEEGVNQATKQLSTAAPSDWIASASVAANDASNSSFSFYIMNLFKRIEVGQGVPVGTYATLGSNGNPTLSEAGRGILLQAVPFIDSVLTDIFITSLSDINVAFKTSNTDTNLQTSINTQKILGNTFATEKTNIANWLGISENSAGGLVAFFIMALMFGISFYVIRDIPSAMLMTFVFSIILAGVGLIPINLMFVLVIIAATYMLFLVWRFVF